MLLKKKNPTYLKPQIPKWLPLLMEIHRIAYIWNYLADFNHVRVYFMVFKHAQSFEIGFQWTGSQSHAARSRSKSF